MVVVRILGNLLNDLQRFAHMFLRAKLIIEGKHAVSALVNDECLQLSRRGLAKEVLGAIS